MTEPESSMAVAEPILEELAQYVVTLRKAGNSYVQIANAVRRKFRFPYFSPEDAHKIVIAAIREYREHLVEDLSDILWLELARLDEAARAIWPQVQRGNKEAISLWIRISESRRKLLGIDQPQKIRLQTEDETVITLRWSAVE